MLEWDLYLQSSRPEGKNTNYVPIKIVFPLCICNSDSNICFEKGECSPGLVKDLKNNYTYQPTTIVFHAKYTPKCDLILTAI